MATHTPEADDPWLIVQENEHRYRIDAVDLRLRIKTRYQNFSMSAMQFKDRRIFEGTVTMTDGEYAGKPIRLLVSEADNGERLGSVMFPALRGEAGAEIPEAEFATSKTSAEKD